MPCFMEAVRHKDPWVMGLPATAGQGSGSQHSKAPAACKPALAAHNSKPSAAASKPEAPGSEAGEIGSKAAGVGPGLEGLKRGQGKGQAQVHAVAPPPSTAPLLLVVRGVVLDVWEQQLQV